MTVRWRSPRSPAPSGSIPRPSAALTTRRWSNCALTSGPKSNERVGCGDAPTVRRVNREDDVAMMRSDGPEHGPNPADRSLWQRCRAMDAPEDEAARLLDLAAYADDRLDVEERERVAARLADDQEASADVRAARALGGIEPGSAGLEQIVARAVAISPDV